MYWNGIVVENIQDISGIGNAKSDVYNCHFVIKEKDGTNHYFHYDTTEAYKERRKIKKLYNEVNKVCESYILENLINIEVDDKVIDFGYRVVNNLDEYEYFTNTQIE